MVQRIIAILLIIAALGLAAFAFLQQQSANERAERALTAQAQAESVMEGALTEVAAASTISARAQTAQAQDQDARATAVIEAREASTSQVEALTAQAEAESAQGTAESRAEAARATGEAVDSAAATAQAESAATLVQAETLLAEAGVTITAEALARGTEQTEQDNLATGQAVRDAALSANPPTPTPAALTASYTSADELVTFNYPANWLVDDSSEGAIYFSNIEVGLASSNQPVSRGALRGFLFVQSPQSANTTSIIDVVNETAASLASGSSSAGNVVQFEQASAIMLGGQAAAIANGSNEGVEFLLVGVPLRDNLYGVFAGISITGEMSQYEPILLSIAASTRSPSAEGSGENLSRPLTSQFVSSEGLIVFNYPDTWVAEEREGQIYFGSNQTTLDNLGSTLSPGDIRGYFTVAFKEQGSLSDVLVEIAGVVFGEAAADAAPPVEISLGGRAGASLIRTDNFGGVFVVGVDLGEVYGVLVGLSTPDVVGQMETTLLSMAATLRLNITQNMGAALTPVPTVATVPTALATTTPDSAVAATATSLAATLLPAASPGEFTTVDGLLSLTYPEDWFVSGSDGQLIISNLEVLLTTNDPPTTGQFVVNIFYGEITDITSLETTATAREVVKLVVTPDEGQQSPFGEISELEAGELPAARSEGRLGGSAVVVIAVIPQPGYVVVGVGYSVAGELPAFEPTLLDILGSVTINSD